MSDTASQGNSFATPSDAQTPGEMTEVNITSSLEGLQTNEQRRVLDTVAEVRKCGLESILSLPQLVVCGDQSAGKSSVLEALTEIPFPRNDNLCTRFATEISLKRANLDALTIKIIPDEKRTSIEQSTINAFKESITDFEELPRIMELAMTTMGISNEAESGAKPRAFARDVLSIIIEGPNRPQLTLVDIPGLIAAKTKVTTNEDIQLVANITHRYISQPRTICLAVISATNDYANQTILEKVRDVDPDGDRTLGIITKPDGLAPGSGSEKAFIELAQNKDIFFKLGWHVVKNRKFEERDFKLEQRNFAEEVFFEISNFKCLPKECVGIDSLRHRLSVLLFEHIKKELPKLKEDLEAALTVAKSKMQKLGRPRSTPLDCKTYLVELSQVYSEICKASVNGHYEDDYFHGNIGADTEPVSDCSVRRTRAVVQSLNTEFSDKLRKHGHKYQIDTSGDTKSSRGTVAAVVLSGKGEPENLTKQEALEWVGAKLVASRGQELIGNFNPLVIGELFWEQSSKWGQLATVHIEEVAQVCRDFLKDLLKKLCLEDVESNIWNHRMEDVLRKRNQDAFEELEKLMADLRRYPINYNHYYTDTITKHRQERQREILAKCVDEATKTVQVEDRFGSCTSERVDRDQAITRFLQSTNADMDNFSCEEALDCLFAIYKVEQKTFIHNVTMQVIERHIVSDLDKIFSSTFVCQLSDSQAESLVSEPTAARNKRKTLGEQISKLEAGQKIFKNII